MLHGVGFPGIRAGVRGVGLRIGATVGSAVAGLRCQTKRFLEATNLFRNRGGLSQDEGIEQVARSSPELNLNSLGFHEWARDCTATTRKQIAEAAARLVEHLDAVGGSPDDRAAWANLRDRLRETSESIEQAVFDHVRSVCPGLYSGSGMTPDEKAVLMTIAERLAGDRGEAIWSTEDRLKWHDLQRVLATVDTSTGLAKRTELNRVWQAVASLEPKGSQEESRLRQQAIKWFKVYL